MRKTGTGIVTALEVLHYPYRSWRSGRGQTHALHAKLSVWVVVDCGGRQVRVWVESAPSPDHRLVAQKRAHLEEWHRHLIGKTVGFTFDRRQRIGFLDGVR